MLSRPIPEFATAIANFVLLAKLEYVAVVTTELMVHVIVVAVVATVTPYMVDGVRDSVLLARGEPTTEDETGHIEQFPRLIVIMYPFVSPLESP